MRIRTKVLILTTLCTIAAMALSAEAPLGKLIWPAKPLPTEPSDAQVAGFIGMGLFQAVAFGLGVSFLAFAYPTLRRHAPTPTRARIVYACVAWLLVSWFPHDNLHMAVGDDPAGLLALMWVFHGSLILAGLALAATFTFPPRGVAAVGGALSAPTTKTTAAASTPPTVPRRA